MEFRNVPLGDSRQSEFLPPDQGAKSQIESAPGAGHLEPAQETVSERRYRISAWDTPHSIFLHKTWPCFSPFSFVFLEWQWASRGSDLPTFFTSCFQKTRSWAACLYDAGSEFHVNQEFSLFFFLSIADLQCYVSFWCITKWFVVFS